MNNSRQAKREGTAYQPKACTEPRRSIPKEMRWGYWTKLKAEEALSHLKKVVFPSLVDLADAKSSFGEYMKTAECKINKASLLIEACNLIDQMQISQQNQDVLGNQYECLLDKLSVVARVEGLSPEGDASRWRRNSPFEARWGGTPSKNDRAGVEGLFERLLAQSFGIA